MFRQFIFTLFTLAMVSGHSRMLDPPNRSSLWRFPEFAQYNPEQNHIDDQIWCDNIRQFEVDNRCGVCGDPISQPIPRENENGGRYGRGIIARTYAQGQVIPIQIEFPAPHGGYFQVQVCDRLPETEDCFKNMVLGNGKTLWPMRLGDGDFLINTTAELPAGVSCEHCVIRMHYRGAQHWGDCDSSASCECDPTGTGGMGCSEQQTFRSCADVRIQ